MHQLCSVVAAHVHDLERVLAQSAIVDDSHAHACVHTRTHTHTRTFTHTQRCTRRQTDRQTDRETDRQTDRQRNRHAYTHSHAQMHFLHTHECIRTLLCFSKEILERFNKPNIRFGSGRTGSKIVPKFRLTHNRKLRSANRNTIDHTIACPALLLWCLAVENRGPCVPKKCSLSNCASPGDSFCQVFDHW